MTLFATTAITGPNGEQVDRDVPIPASWPLDGEFVREGLAHGWLVERDAPAVTPLAAAPPQGLAAKPDGPSSDPYAYLAATPTDVGGTAVRRNRHEE